MVLKMLQIENMSNNVSELNFQIKRNYTERRGKL